jgi:hypothetical protein
VANLDSERSQEALACRAFFDLALENTLRDFNWPFATKIAALNLVEEDPNDEWGFSYRYPPDCLKVRRILSGTRTDTVDTREKYRITRDDAGLLILADKEDAEIEYTMRTTDPERYPSDFVMALSFRLAVYIAPRVTGGDPFKLKESCYQSYNMEIGKAYSSALNEEQPDIDPESEFITGRE